MKHSLSLLLLVTLSMPLLGAKTPPIEMKDFPILTERRLELTREYSKRHYDMDTYLLDPKIIVIHYTALSSLRFSLNTFKPDTIPNHREKIAPFGRVNVGVHYVVSPEGEIYSLLPTTVMGRHVTGYNHVSIGIENVAAKSDQLTKEQIKENAKLVAFLLDRHPQIEYLMGHHEYMHIRYPHYVYYKAHDPSYEPLIKVDPGFSFMKQLRDMLRKDYGIELKK
jgi:N-acetyl-anhydromuramyl-L-alanine amidase AmpD